MQGVLSIACFTLVGAAFWRFGWKIGLLRFVFGYYCRKRTSYSYS